MRNGWGNIKFPLQKHGNYKDAGFFFILNDQVCAWGLDSSSVANASAAFPQGDGTNTLTSQVYNMRKMSFSWHNLISGGYVKNAPYSPTFVDVASCEYVTMALDSVGGVWVQSPNVTFAGITTTPTGSTLVGLTPINALYPVPFFISQGIQIARIFITPTSNQNNASTIIGCLTTIGELYLFGLNTGGQLGQGNTTAYTQWVKYPIVNIKDVYLTMGLCYVHTTDNNLYVTGVDSYTMVGGGNKTTPYLLATNVKMFDVGHYNGGQCIVLKNDGTVWNGGLNNFNQLGRGGTTNQAFSQVSAITGAKFVACDRVNGSATGYIGSDNNAYFAGQNTNGKFATTTPAYNANTTSVYAKSDLGDFGWKGVVKTFEIGNNLTTILTTTGKLYNTGNSAIKGIGFASLVNADSNLWSQVPVSTVIDFKAWDNSYEHNYILTDRGIYTFSYQGWGSFTSANTSYKSPSFVPYAKFDNGIVTSNALDLTLPQNPVTTGTWEFEYSGAEYFKNNLETLSINHTVLAGVPTHFFVSNNNTGIFNGILSGAGNVDIFGVAEQIVGVTYQPGGILVLKSVNTCTGTLTNESGAKVDMGDYTWTGTGRIWAGAIVNSGQMNFKWQAGQNITPTTQASFTNNAGGVLSFSTNDGNQCQLISGGVIGATTRVNNGLIEIKNIVIQLNGPSFTGTGSIRVFSGATLITSPNSWGATQTIYVSGNGGLSQTGCCYSGVIEATGVNSINSPIVLEGDSRFGNNNVASNVITISSIVTSNGFNLEIGGGSCQVASSGFTFNNANNDLTNSIVTVNGAFLRTYNDCLKTCKKLYVKNGASYRPNAGALNAAEEISAVDIDATSFLSTEGQQGLALMSTTEESIIRCGLGAFTSNGFISHRGTLTLTSNQANTGGSYIYTSQPTSLLRIGEIGQSTPARIPGYSYLYGGGTIEACVTVGDSFVGVGLLWNVSAHNLNFRAKLDGTPTSIRSLGGINKTTQTTIHLLEPMIAGTHTLVAWNGGTTAISGGVVLGTNLSGRTVTSLTISGAGIVITLL